MTSSEYCVDMYTSSPSWILYEYYKKTTKQYNSTIELLVYYFCFIYFYLTPPESRYSKEQAHIFLLFFYDSWLSTPSTLLHSTHAAPSVYDNSLTACRADSVDDAPSYITTTLDDTARCLLNRLLSSLVVQQAACMCDATRMIYTVAERVYTPIEP